MKAQKSDKNVFFKGAILSSLVMAFAGLGDSFLYPLLPVYGKEMGFSVFTIGLLLSINRFVRILTNTQIANAVYKLGRKKIMVITAIISAVSTWLYGMEVSLIGFFIARVCWGLCFSGLKIATLSYAAQEKQKSGFTFGLAEGIKNFGGLLVLWFGPILVEFFGISNGLYLIALISGIGIIISLKLPNIDFDENEKKVITKKTFFPSIINLLVFTLAISIDGILVVALAQLLAGSVIVTTKLLVIVSSYLLIKKISATCLSIIIGALTLRISPYKLYSYSVIMCITGLVLISANMMAIGIVLAFLFYAVTSTFSPLIATQLEKEDNGVLQALSGVSTWRDLGAAMGAFLGIYLVSIISKELLFSLISLIILGLFIVIFRRFRLFKLL